MDPESRLLRGWRSRALAVVLAALTVILVQHNTGAWTAGYGAYPDESSHLMGGLMIRDYVGSPGESPIEFARSYYLFQPYFAIGYWPPLFYLVEGAWMLVFGYGRISVMVLVGAIAVANALLLFGVARRRAGAFWALAAMLLFLLTPSVRWSSTVVMTDLSVALVCLATTLALGAYFDRPTWPRAIIAGLLAGLAILTKYLAAFVLLPPVLLLLLDRRWDLVSNVRTWSMIAVFAATCGPWLYWARRFATIGVEGGPATAWAARLYALGWGLIADFGFLLCGALAIGMARAVWRWRELPSAWRLMVLLPPAAFGFIIIAPTEVEPRYLMVAYASLLAVTALGAHAAQRRLGLSEGAAALIGLATVVGFAWLHPSQYTALPPEVTREAARAVIASTPTTPVAILVPTPLEGPMIVELATAQRTRPGSVFVRPTKLLARANWLGTEYALTAGDVAAMKSLFEQYPIDTVLLARVPGKTDTPHDLLLRAMVDDPANGWTRAPQSWRDGGTVIERYIRPASQGRSLRALLSFLQERSRQAP